VGRAEVARARLLELVPDGFEEVERGAELELVAYVGRQLEPELREAFRLVSAADVPEGWADAWRRFHRPLRIGPLWIGPPWERPPAGVPAVVIDPGRAFGTGAHATTRLCLELLLTLEPASLVDLGCGSGVLAISAAKLGFSPVVAIDRDEDAVAATRTNAAANRVPVETRVGDVLEGTLPDASIGLANLERGLVGRLAARAVPETLVVSGFLASDRLELPAGWSREGRRELTGWAAELLRRDPGC
jgi:ribosomal protein L11 methyltransferase